MRQLQETLGNVAYQLWVLQVVGSNPAAPTKNTVEFLAFFLRFRRDSDTRFLRCSAVMAETRQPGASSFQVLVFAWRVQAGIDQSDSCGIVDEIVRTVDRFVYRSGAADNSMSWLHSSAKHICILLLIFAIYR